MEEEFNLISKTIGRTILDQDPMTLIFVASHHARLHLFSEYGVIQEIFNFELNLARNFDKITINCDNRFNVVLAMIHNEIVTKYDTEYPIDYSDKLTVEALFFEIEDLIKEVGRDFVLSLNNVEDLSLDELDEILSFFRVHLIPVICTCDVPSLYNRLECLTYATVHFIEGYTREQLTIIYEAMQRKFNIQLPEYSIDTLITLQLKEENRFAYYGKDFFEKL